MIDIVRGEDMNEVMDIWLSVNVSAHNFINAKYWICNYDKVRDELIPSCENYKVVIDTEIAGFISIVNSNYIGALFVKGKFQGRGVGKQLLDYCVEKYKHLTLNVYVKNQKAVKFYKKNGFTILREISTNGENAYIMNIDYNGPVKVGNDFANGQYSFF